MRRMRSRTLIHSLYETARLSAIYLQANSFALYSWDNRRLTQVPRLRARPVHRLLDDYRTD